MATGYNVRVGDAERDAAAAQLREHYTTGRLTLDELNERLDQAFAARTRADLNAVTRDLPYVRTPSASSPGGPSPLAAPSGRPGWGGQSTGAGGGTGPRRGGLLTGIAYLIPALVAVWGLLILGGLFVFGFGGGRPLGIVFLLAALALIRRMFGRRRGYARRGGRCGRRW
jgi:hypothetical protein